MTSLPSETHHQQQQQQSISQKIPNSHRCSSSLFLMGGISSQTKATSTKVTNDRLGSCQLTQGKSLSRRTLPVQKAQETAPLDPPKFPVLSGNTDSVLPKEIFGGSKSTKQAIKQHIFDLLPQSPSSSNGIDIAREAMRLTRETLHGVIDSNVVPLLTENRLRQDSTGSAVSSDGDNTLAHGSVAQRDSSTTGNAMRLNKFVRRLYNMLNECDSGVVEWRRGLLVLKDTHAFAKDILPKYFNTRNFKTFRRQLNYYGFVHIRSFSNNGDSTTALWVNGELAGSPCAAGTDPDHVSSVLLLRRVEPCDQVKTAEMRRARKELAISTIEKDFGVSAKTLQLQQLGNLRSQSMLAKRQAKQKQQQRPKPISKSKTKPIVVVEHHTHCPEKPMDVDQPTILPIPMESVNYNADIPQQMQNTVQESSSEPPAFSSSTSAANLLLLLSKA